MDIHLDPTGWKVLGHEEGAKGDIKGTSGAVIPLPKVSLLSRNEEIGE